MVEFVRQICKRMEAPKYPAKQVGRVVYRSVNMRVCTNFSHYYIVYDYTSCFLPTVVEDVVVL